MSETAKIYQYPREQMTRELEQGLLSALIVDNRCYDRVAGLVGPEDFAEPLHARIFIGVGDLASRGEQANPLTLQTYAEDGGDDPVVIRKYLVRLMMSAITTVNAVSYARSIQDASIGRRLVEEANEAIAAAGDSEDTARDIAVRTAAALEALAGDRERNTAKFSEAVDAALRAEQLAFDTGGRSAGVPTGLRSLDRLTGGLPNSEITIIGARTGLGKTALAGTIARNAADAGNRVLFFSLEMTMAQLATRLIAAEARVDGAGASRGKLRDGERQAFTDGAARVRDLGITIDHSSNVDSDAICARARAAWRAGRCDLLIIDYLGLVRSGDRYRGNRVYEIEEITRALKGLANQCDIPVLLLHQLNRAVEQRDDKRPTLADLRDSGALEQDAGMVLLIYRHDYYLQRSEPDGSNMGKLADWQDQMRLCRGKAEITVAKMRSGPANITRIVDFDATAGRFYEADEEGLPEEMF